MKELKPEGEVKLIIGFIFKAPEYFKKAKKALIIKFGDIDFESDVLPFFHTDYYQKEFGRNLKRKFIAFTNLILPHQISDIKNITNKIEKKLSIKDKRKINIDPGYISPSKLVLATTKDYSHRIYLKNGIYAEVTLLYKKKSFSPWPWTYPDYKSYNYIEIFNSIRSIYIKQTIKKK